MSQAFKTFIKQDSGDYRYQSYEPLHIIGGDTDSAYIDLCGVFDSDSNEADVIKYADKLGESVNATFPEFMMDVFNCTDNQAKIISTEREVVSDKSFFSAKKNYMMHIIDKGGLKPKSEDDEYKIMGLAVRKSDTPKVVQDFLKQMILLIMDNAPYEEVHKFVYDFKAHYTSLHISEIGRPMNVKNINKYMDVFIKTGEMKGIPYHMRAAMFYNNLCGANDIKIRSGDKMKIAYITHPETNYIAIPADADVYPEFLTEIKIDWNAQWQTVEKKVIAYLKPIGYDPESRHKERLKDLIVF
jgi:DNA polymerase elongation subunit (family B)